MTQQYQLILLCLAVVVGVILCCCAVVLTGAMVEFLTQPINVKVSQQQSFSQWGQMTRQESPDQVRKSKIVQ